MNYTKKAAKGLGAVLLMSVFASVIAYLTRMILARVLTPLEYGLYYAVFTFVTFLLFFRDFGFSKAAVKYISEFRTTDKFREIKTTICSVGLMQLVVSLTLAGILFFASDFLALHYFKNPLAGTILRLLLIYVVLSAVFILLKNIIYSFQRFALYSVIGVLKNLFVLFTIIFLFALGIKNSLTPTLAMVIVAPFLILILIPFSLNLFKIMKYKITCFREITKKLLIYGLPVMLASVGGKIIGHLDTLLLTYFRTLEEVATYNVVLPTATMLLFFSSSISVIAFPMVSELAAKKDKLKLTSGIRLIHLYTFFFVIPALLSVIIFSEFFIRLLFGENYVAGKLAMQILIFGVLFFSVATINNNILNGLGKPQQVTKIVLLAAFVNLILNMFLIPLYGIEGAALTTMVSYLLVFICSSYLVAKHSKSKLPWAEWFKLFLSGGCFFTVVILLKKLLVFNDWIELVFFPAIGLVIYLILVSYVFKVIRWDEVKKYYKIFRKND